MRKDAHLVHREGRGPALLAVAVAAHKALQAAHLGLPRAQVLLAARQRCGRNAREVLVVQEVGRHLAAGQGVTQARLGPTPQGLSRACADGCCSVVDDGMRSPGCYRPDRHAPSGVLCQCCAGAHLTDGPLARQDAALQAAGQGARQCGRCRAGQPRQARGAARVVRHAGLLVQGLEDGHRLAPLVRQEVAAAWARGRDRSDRPTQQRRQQRQQQAGVAVTTCDVPRTDLNKMMALTFRSSWT